MDTLTSPVLLYLALACLAAGAAGALALGRYDRAANVYGNGLAVIGSAAAFVFAGASLVSGTGQTLSAATSFPLLSLSIRIDRLSAFFLLVIAFVALLCSVYAISYVRHYYGKYSLGVLGCFYNLFVASMLLVAAAHNALFFLIAWEVMSLASYFLVIYERRESASIKAGSLYFIMTHAGTAFIIVAFLLMFREAGSFEFDAIRNGLAGASPLVQSAIFTAALVGFGTKAGIIPLHIWLPSAHPAAPSHVSALMSGVMIKTGIYMLIRITLDLLPGVSLWWGLALLVIGAVSSLLGVLYALTEHDLKRLLAYHSIENIGIILLGLGSALVFASAGSRSLAALGLMAALFHTINHATFKALLFLGAGAVIGATHTRNIEKYGGLIRAMPGTALFFLVGSMAISALPPFNGFFSEWLTFQSLFPGVTGFGVITRIVFIFAIGALAFTGGLAAACFVKAFGITFLARPRSRAAGEARETGWPARVAMAGFALATLLLGVGAGIATRFLGDIAAGLAGLRIVNTSAAADAGSSSVSVQEGFARVSMPAVFAALALAGAATLLAVLVWARRRRRVIARTWDCGADLTPRMEITATGFSRSIITVARGLLRPSSETEIEYHDANRYFPKAGTVSMGLTDVYRAFIYRPLHDATNAVAGIMRRVQSGNIHGYILYIFLTLIGLLLFLDVQL